MSEDRIGVKEFHIEDIPLSCTWFIVGVPGSGKGKLVENLLYYNRDKYPVGKFFTGSPTDEEKISGIAHPLYITSTYDKEAERQHIQRQRLMIQENGRGYAGNYAVNVLDDITDDPKVFKTQEIKGIFKIGSQHWAQLAIVTSQYAMDVPPDVRRSISYVALFKEENETELKKLYKNFGGVFGTYNNFCRAMKEFTGDYTCLIINRRSQSSKIEDCVSYYRTKLLPKNWSFGCKEYIEWAKKRYNSDRRVGGVPGL